MSVKKEYFGEMPDGREVSLYTITNKNGLEASRHRSRPSGSAWSFR